MRKIDVKEKYGRLTPIRPTDKRVDGRICWLFRCDCGNEKELVGRDVLVKHSQSCGCQKKEINRKRGSDSYTGYKDLSSSYWAQIKKGARKRKLEFSITIEYVWDLLEKQDFKCALSGLPISCSRHYSKHPLLQIASLDRIDSSKGYVEGNVEWLHKTVNCMKNNFSKEEFINLCKEVDAHAKSVRK